MVVGYTVNHLYYFPVEKVVNAHLIQLSSHPEKNTIDVVEIKHENDPSGLDYLKRVITSLNTLPKIIRTMSVFDQNEIQTEEEVWMDHAGRRFWLRHHNLSFADTVTIQENSTFVPDSTNPEWTHFEQAGGADMSNLGFMGKVIEVLLKSVMERNVRLNITLMEEILNRKP